MEPFIFSEIDMISFISNKYVILQMLANICLWMLPCHIGGKCGYIVDT